MTVGTLLLVTGQRRVISANLAVEWVKNSGSRRRQSVLREDFPCRDGIAIRDLYANAVHAAHEDHGIRLRRQFVRDVARDAAALEQRP